MKKTIILYVLLWGFFAYSSQQKQEICSKNLKLEKHCPLVVGNKTFNKSDLEKVAESQLDDLIKIANPHCCLRLCGINSGTITPYDFDKLRGMPKKIRKEMIINRCSYDKIVDGKRVEYCTDATTCSVVGVTAAEGWGWMATGCSLSNTTLWGLFCVWVGAAATPCLCCTAYTCGEVCCCKNIKEEMSGF